MTRPEFTGQFKRLCAGFTHTATEEQAEAWYRRIGHYAVSVWAESVTTLLCNKYFPKLDEALKTLDEEAEAQRRVAVEQDKFKAKKTYTLLNQPVNPAEQSRIPTPGTPLFACIRAFASRAEAAKRLAALKLDTKRTEPEKRREQERLAVFFAQAEADIAEYSPLIHDEDAARLVRQYEMPLAS